jgi:hypothetical protein
MTGQHIPHFLFMRDTALYPVEPVTRGHQNSGSTKPALQRMMSFKRLLQITEFTLLGRQSFNCIDASSVNLRGQRQTCALRHAIDQYSACPADAMLTAHVRTGSTDPMP